MKKNIYFLLMIIFLYGCQNSATEIYNENFKWRITIPENYSSQPMAAQEMGTRLIEQAYNQEANIVAIPVFNYMKGKYTKLQAQYIELDSVKDFITKFNEANIIVEKTFKYHRPKSKYKTQYSTKIISGLEFKTFKMTIHSEDNTITVFQNFSRLFGNKKLDIIIVYQDQISGNELMKTLETSQFE